VIGARRAAAIIFAAAVLAGGSYLLPRPDASSSPDPRTGRFHNDAGMKSTDEQIRLWRRRFDENPRDFISLTYLGAALIQKGRETGDLGAYERAGAALRRAIEIHPDDAVATTYLGATLIATHDFSGARELAARAFAKDAQLLQALATLGDADLELGNYASAEAAYQKIESHGALGPALEARRARLAWLRGQVAEAIALLDRADDQARAGGALGEGAAWYEAQLGDLLFRSGRLEAAAQRYTGALDLFDGYHVALAGLARVRAAQGRVEEAIGLYRKAIAVVPEPDYLSALGDLYMLSGETRSAREQYATVETIATLAALNRQVYDRQLALFYADHDLKIAEALRIAEVALDARRDIFGYDTYAWALYKSGRYADARSASERALSLGTKDARLLYHAGMISLALGETARGQEELLDALTLCPSFDPLQAARARDALAKASSR
jgi:tetratricopeptide (TPR) repeat protein